MDRHVTAQNWKYTVAGGACYTVACDPTHKCQVGFYVFLFRCLCAAFSALSVVWATRVVTLVCVPAKNQQLTRYDTP